MQETWLRIITRAWNEPEFKDRLIADTTAVLREYDVELIKGTSYKVVEDGIDGVHYLVLPPKPTEQALRIDSFGRKSQSGDPGF
ncbi:MAG TPA: nitrile hydratase subunit alpha [Polyangiaceae bacterium]|nr:nitrile hydratase subunit alpha [Polyangiaceae bacterium]